CVRDLPIKSATYGLGGQITSLFTTSTFTTCAGAASRITLFNFSVPSLFMFLFLLTIWEAIVTFFPNEAACFLLLYHLCFEYLTFLCFGLHAKRDAIGAGCLLGTALT